MIHSFLFSVNDSSCAKMQKFSVFFKRKEITFHHQVTKEKLFYYTIYNQAFVWYYKYLTVF
jgi:hypothetical protein